MKQMDHMVTVVPELDFDSCSSVEMLTFGGEGRGFDKKHNRRGLKLEKYTKKYTHHFPK